MSKTRKPKLTNMDYIPNPFVVAVDTREQMPYRFQGIACDSDKKFLPLVIETKSQTLETGDYSIVGLENKFTIERKSREDAYSTIIHDHARFKRELERMSAMEFAMVIVECQEDDLYAYVKSETGANPKSLYRSLIKWPVQYGVHFRFSNGRGRAMRDAFRTMQAVWKLWGGE